MKNFRAAAFCSWPMPRRTSQFVGHVRIGDLMPMVPVNSVVGDFKDLNNIPIRSRGTQTIFIRVLGSVEDGADIQTGYALVDGHRTVYIPAK